MRRRKFLIIVAILMLAVGFAAVSTTLYINGLTTISKNEIFVDDIIFTEAKAHDESTASINETGKIITFNSKVLKNLGEKTTLDYTISNYNRQYDANVVVSIRMKEENNPLSEYIKITNSLNGEFTLNAQSEKSGQLEIELMKLYTGEEDVRIEFTIEYQASGLERNTLADEILPKENQTWEFDYTGEEKLFNIPTSGNYKLETWGASGGNADSYTGGSGGYSTITINLAKDTPLYINVGQAGESVSGSPSSNPYSAYNGGGKSSNQNGHLYGSGSGGATHIAYLSGILSALSENRESILLVAGGGGGAASGINGDSTIYGFGGSGGGLTGVDGTNVSFTRTFGKGGTSETAGTSSNDGGKYPEIVSGFGQGCSPSISYDSYMLVAGGAGFYGGGCGTHSGGGGGSGYVSTTEGVTISGIEEMPTHDGTSTMIGNIGNGYAKITYLGK